jgi:hypothetical protein
MTVGGGVTIAPDAMSAFDPLRTFHWAAKGDTRATKWMAMFTNWIEFRFARRLIEGLALGAAIVCGPTPSLAAGASSSQQDRERFVTITRQLERAPLDASLRADRAWAVRWLTEAPDVSVTVCADTLGGVLQSDYPHTQEIVVQYTLSIGAHVVEHPTATNDPIAQQIAGAEGALAAYSSILRDEPDSKSPALEEMLQARARGELPDFVRMAFKNCTESE